MVSLGISSPNTIVQSNRKELDMNSMKIAGEPLPS
jgi:hypothetical protein